MAVTTCPDCGREVSTLAEACPQCGHPFTPQQAETLKTEVSRSAVASLVFSLLWLGGIGSILAVIFGHASLRQIRRSGGRLRGHGIAMAGTILGYVGIVGAVAVLIAAILLGDEINSTFDAQGTETTTSVASITTTTFPWQGWLDDIEARNAEDARVALLFWAVPHVGSARRWAESAVEYAEALDRRSDDREEAISSLLALGLSVCRQLVAYESDNVGGSPKSPAQVEADMRDTLGLEGWELLGPVWYESLVYGLCVR